MVNDAQYLINIDFCIFPSYTDRQDLGNLCL